MYLEYTEGSFWFISSKCGHYSLMVTFIQDIQPAVVQTTATVLQKNKVKHQK